MPPHVERMQEEHEQLEERLTKLDAFISSSPVYASLPEADRDLLNAQHAAMKVYRTVLAIRISRERDKMPV